LAGRVQFESVKAAVRLELDVIVDEPEFVELFDFVISLGGAKNTYIPGLIEFAERYVDQKKRQLRLQAFGEINKMPPGCPRTKIATLKRAYRQDPSHGFCPVPESRLVQSTSGELKSLEELLQFFHVTMSSAVAEVGDLHSRIAFLANVDVSAVAAFVSSPKTKIRESILNATTKYFFQLNQTLMPMLEGRLMWIQFNKIPDTATAVADDLLQPKLLTFDEQSGRVSDKQDERVDAVIPENKPYAVPWRQWCSGKAFRELGLKQAEMSAAKQILDLLHTKAHVKDMPIEVFFDPIRRIYRVVATSSIAAGTLFLPPCVPKQATLLETSEHPCRAQVLVQRRKQQLGLTAVAAIPPTVYYINPEWKVPELVEKKDASIAEACEINSDIGGPIWKWKGDETMHPYWAVRRISVAQLKEEAGKTMPFNNIEYNMHLVPKTYNVVGVGAFGSTTLSTTFEVVIHMFVNIDDMVEGEEMVFESVAKKVKEKRKEIWKDDVAKQKKAKDKGEEKQVSTVKPTKEKMKDIEI
jgi:hypothetical protein